MTAAARATPAEAVVYSAEPGPDRDAATYRVAPLEPARPGPDTAAPPPRPSRAPVLLSGDALEYERVRSLLYELRPDYPDYLVPLPAARTALETVRIRDPMASWGDVPRALLHKFSAPVDARGAVVLARARALAPDAAAVLCWLRAFAELARVGQHDPGGALRALRSLYYDVGVAFADAAQTALWTNDLLAKRDGAYHSGRTYTLKAAAEFGMPAA